MEPRYYIGLDVHKRKISYCVKDSGGKVYAEGSLPATRIDLELWMKTLPQPWSAAMEATMFTGWIYDHLKPHAAALKVAHPLMLRAIAAAKRRMTASTPTRFATACGAKRGTMAEKPAHAAKNQKEFTPALLQSASGELLPS